MEKQKGIAKDTWQASHSCPINFQGSAPAMEPEGVNRIFARYEETRKLQYTFTCKIRKTAYELLARLFCLL